MAIDYIDRELCKEACNEMIDRRRNALALQSAQEQLGAMTTRGLHDPSEAGIEAAIQQTPHTEMWEERVDWTRE